MKKIMTFKAIKNIICTIAILLPLQFGTGLTVINNNDTSSNSIDLEPVPRETRVVLLDLKGEYCDIKCFLTQNIETIEFFSKVFGINKDVIIENIISINHMTKYSKNNIGSITDKNGELIDYGSFEKGLIEYLFAFAKKNPKLVNNTRVPYNGNADYVVNLIKYFCSIYDNVDYLTAVSIGAAESGYYKVKYMLNCNNIYGGMSSSGLIKYKNIEYGVLSFIRLLSINYYGKGLTTKESIGKIYCPTYDANGNKVASAHWINLVNKAMRYYENSYQVLSVSDLNID